jgi:hypothetical protein
MGPKSATFRVTTVRSCVSAVAAISASRSGTKFAPGAELVVAAMGVLFEAGKVSAFILLHKKMPRALKAALLTVGLILMGLNIAGVSGFLSNAYEHQQISVKAASHTAEASAYASASLIERQLAAVEVNLAAARTAQIKARDDKGRARAAKAIVDLATAERDALVRQLSTAQTTQAQAEGATIISGSEFAAIGFVSAATGFATESVAHMVIFIISALPDTLAILLLVAATYNKPAPAIPRPTRTSKPARRRRPRFGLNPKLKVVPNVPAKA